MFSFKFLFAFPLAVPPISLALNLLALQSLGQAVNCFKEIKG